VTAAARVIRWTPAGAVVSVAAVASYRNAYALVRGCPDKDVGARLSALNDLASKGVHVDVTTYEVDTCVVQTYLVVADVLHIRERATIAEDA
jgi:hypothetical protein